MSAKQLQILINSRSFSTSAGEIKLVPFKFKQFTIALEIIEQYLLIITTYDKAELIVELLAKTDDKFKLLTDVVSLLGLVSDWTAEKFEELGYDEVISLLTEIIEMNIDFFSQIGKRLNPEQKTEPLPSSTATTGASELAA